MTSVRVVVLGVSSFLLAACGGSFESGSRGDGLESDGGPSEGTGGAVAGGTGGVSSSTGGAVAAGGAQACCLAAAVCNPGDLEIPNKDACPEGATCYENSICCSTVWCVQQAATCDAFPACDPEDRQIDGECPPAYSCYSRSLCGSTITCLDQLPDGGPAPIGPGVDGGAACNRSAELDRHYVAESPAQCAVVDFLCPANTVHFANACGCGCEQPSSCPDWVNCMPGSPTVSPLCEDDSTCPYTVRAW